MLLREALNVKDDDVISFVGAGGKTTAALRLMEELAGIAQRVIFTTTTKILEPIPRESECLLLAGEEEALAQIPELLTRYPKAFLANRRLAEVDPAAVGKSGKDYPMRLYKLEGVSPSLVNHLARRLRETAILVEADGACHRALKAPAAYEPVVPASTTILVPMVDLAVLGKPLTEKHVHRPELVTGLTGTAIGQPVTIEMVATLLSHPQGGLKGLSEQARAIPILNIGSGRERIGPCAKISCIPNPLLDEARQIAHLILQSDRIEQVVIASLRAPDPVLEVIAK